MITKPVGTIETTIDINNFTTESLVRQGLRHITGDDVGVGDILPVLQDGGELVWGEVISIYGRSSFKIKTRNGWAALLYSWAWTSAEWKAPKLAHICSRDGHEVVDLGGLIKSWCKHCDTTLWYHRDVGAFDVADPFKKGA